MVLGILMAGTFMAILDTSIVNVALPEIMSAFGVNRERIEWVSTGFMLASAVTMPLVGWISDRFRYERLYLASLALFTIGSALCALAWSLESLVVARIVQAVGGGAIQPLGMALIADLFSPEERGRALGIWGTGIMLGPAIGPTLGGYLTDWFSWRSIFSINLPVGVVTLVAGFVIMNMSEDRDQQGRTFDAMGYAFLSMFLIASLLGLSNGEREGWMSPYIMTCASLSIVGLVMFLATELSVEHPLLDLGLFKHRNYTLSLLLAVFRSLALFGGVFLLPIFLQNLAGYTTIQTGLWLMPGAVAVGVCMPIAGQLADRFNPRWLVAIGSFLTGGSLMLFGFLDPSSGAVQIIGPQLIRGIGLALMMSPLMAAALNAVPQRDIATASSFINITSRVGGAFGIAILNTLVTHAATLHAVRLGESMPPASRAFHHTATWAASHLEGVGGASLVLRLIGMKAQVLAFDNGFVFAGLILVVAGVPLSMFLAPRVRSKGGRSTGSRAKGHSQPETDVLVGHE